MVRIHLCCALVCSKLTQIPKFPMCSQGSQHKLEPMQADLAMPTKLGTGSGARSSHSNLCWLQLQRCQRAGW